MEATLNKNENYTWKFVKKTWKYHGILSLWKNGNPDLWLVLAHRHTQQTYDLIYNDCLSFTVLAHRVSLQS